MATCLTNGSGNEALLVTDDRDFARQLRHALWKDHHCAIEVTGSLKSAGQLVGTRRFEAVFVDFRRKLKGDEARTLVESLSSSASRRMPVIAVSDGGYVFDWAVVADLVASGHLHLPLDRSQLAGLLKRHGGQQASSDHAAWLRPRSVTARSVTYTTYTPAMIRLLDDLVTMATHDVTILLVGETGTGKTTLARLVHELSPRNEARFLHIACGALPPELIESELFGHAKGAFTSADQSKAGKFDVARGGSLLLDEIDVLGLAQQAKLLRVIETGEYEPVGSNETRQSGARLIVASNVDLQQLMQRDQFRADLYYRLNMLECRIPPLRERPADIVPLTLDFVEEFCRAHRCAIRRVHPEFLACLKAYDWPGNVRELKNHVRRAVLFCPDGVLTPENLAPQFRGTLNDSRGVSPGELAAEPGLPMDASLFERVAVSERAILERALAEHDQNRTATARSLGMSRVGLYKKLKKYGMVTPRSN